MCFVSGLPKTHKDSNAVETCIHFWLYCVQNLQPLGSTPYCNASSPGVGIDGRNLASQPLGGHRQCAMRQVAKVVGQIRVVASHKPQSVRNLHRRKQDLAHQKVTNCIRSVAIDQQMWIDHIANAFCSSIVHTTHVHTSTWQAANPWQTTWSTSTPVWSECLCHQTIRRRPPTAKNLRSIPLDGSQWQNVVQQGINLP